MKTRFAIIMGCVSLLALGSAVALAQSAPQYLPVQDLPVEAPVVSTPPEPAAAPAPAQANSTPPPAPNPSASPPSDAEPSPVEDAPVDVPASTQSDWAPDINLDAQTQADAATRTPQRKPKPRKILSDAGENALGTNSWSQSANSEAAEAALLARSTRRERKVDPVKRAELTKLSRIMGALHALRVSCSGRDDQTYRSRMATMLDLEAPDSGELRDPLVDAFNGGFQVYGRGASVCPTDARVQEAALAKEGIVLARTLGARYRPAPKVAAKLPPANQPRVNAVPVASASAARKNVAPAAAPNAGKAVPARPTWTNSTSN
jgi:uncharacterized protein (TIGR02301 family)